MDKPASLTELGRAIKVIQQCAPYSTSVLAKPFQDALERLRNVEAILLTIHELRPQSLIALESMAFEELEAQYGDPLPAVTALIGRYCRKRESLR